jgi:hypothetical protein
MAPGETLAVERLVGGRAEEALRGYLATGADGSTLAAITQRMLSVPTLASQTISFLELIARTRPPNAAVQVALGNARMVGGLRAAATGSYRQAVALDSANTAATRALERLGALPVRGGEPAWTVPFSLDDLFRPPTPAEIDTVWARWRRRDLRSSDVDTVLVRHVDLGHTKATVRVLSHRVHGFRHVGAVIVPDGAAPGCCPVVLSAKGVSWNFSALRIPDGVDVLSVLGPDQNRFVYVVPAYRGEVMWVGADSLRSEGDRSDAWDGATDDLLALLDVALATTPEADSTRVCAFGRSRGGTVALLAGERDRRIGCVVAWAAPTDWFALMGGGGWRLEELAADGLRHRAATNQTGGQFVNYFLKPSIEGRSDLLETRLHLIASSPLYFAEHLPAEQAHYGVDDGIVPMANGRALTERLRQGKRLAGCSEVFFHQNAGHDQDLFAAPRASKRILMQMRDERPPRCRTGAG